MSGQHTVSSLTAHRQVRPLHMSHRHLQDLFIDRMVKRQRHTDGRDLNITHDAISVHIQKRGIKRLLFRCQQIRIAGAHAAGIIGNGI